MSQVIKSKMVKTRKNHLCFGCYNYQIPKGSTALSITHTESSGIYTNYYCDLCQETIKEFSCGDEFASGDLQATREEEYPYQKDEDVRKLSKQGE